jgi:hypothetical protein
MALTETEELELLELERERAQVFTPGVFTPGGFAKNIAQDVFDIAKSVPSAVSSAASIAMRPNVLSGTPAAPMASAFNAIKDMGAGKALKTFIEQPTTAIAQRAGEIASNPAKAFYEKPVSTAMDIASVAGAGAGALKGVGKIASAVTPNAELSLMKALKPGNMKTNFMGSIRNTINDLADATQGKVPQNSVEFYEVLKKAKQNIWNSNQALSSKASVPISTSKVADKMMEPLANNTRFLKQNPDVVEAIKKKAEIYKNQQLTPNDIEEYLRSVNNELNSHYAKNNFRQRVDISDPEKGYLVAEAKGLRELLEESIQKATGRGAEAMLLRKKYGDLLNIEEALVKRMPIAESLQPFSLQEAVNIPIAIGRSVAGAATGRLGEAAGGLAQIMASVAAKELNTTNGLIRNAFTKALKQKKNAVGLGKIKPIIAGVQAVRLNSNQ